MDSARDKGPLGPWNEGTLYRKWIGRYWFGYTTDADRKWAFQRLRSVAGTMYILWMGRRNFSFGIMHKW